MIVMHNGKAQLQGKVCLQAYRLMYVQKDKNNSPSKSRGQEIYIVLVPDTEFAVKLAT